MRKILSCEFNLDTACVELVMKDGALLAIDCIAVENEVTNSMCQRSELSKGCDKENSVRLMAKKIRQKQHSKGAPGGFFLFL